MASYYSGPTLSREQAAQVASQAGFSGETLVQMVAIAGRESSYVAGAHRTDSSRSRLSGDRGLWQINYIWDDDLKRAGIINSAQDLFDPAINAKAAKFVFDRQGLDAWAMGSNGYRSGGDPFKSTDVSAARAAVGRASSQGLLAQPWQSGSGGTAGGGLTGLPSDARLLQTTDGGGINALFNIGGGVWIRYNGVPASLVAGRPIERITSAAYKKKYGAVVFGGNAEELADIPTAFGNYAGYVKQILDQMFTKGDPRRNDPEILRVLATRAGRPDMTEAEFENLLKATKYYQARTEGQLRWNDLSEAQRRQETVDMAARMAQSYQQLAGSPIATSDKWLSYYADRVASGLLTFGQWTEQVLKPAAKLNPESPWSRTLRDETESQRQRPIDIENTALRVRDLLTQWGLDWSEASVQSWARGIMEKTKSDEDLLNTVKQQAMTLYPWKDPEVETMVAAAPWIETYNRVLERQGSLATADIKKVLSAYGRDPDNNDPWSFEQRLKMTDQYDQTRQGQDDAWSSVGELAGMMGF